MFTAFGTLPSCYEFLIHENDTAAFQSETIINNMLKHLKLGLTKMQKMIQFEYSH